MDTPDAINSRCQLMATLSPLVRQKVETEQWRTCFDNSDPTGDSIQQALFLCLISDMTDIGIETISAADDLYENTYDLDLLLAALGWVFPNTFYPRMRRDAGLKAGIENLLNGSIEGDMLHNYLDFIGGSDGGEGYISGLYDACVFAKSALVSNSVFTTYLTAMLENARDEVDVSTYAINDPKAYHAAVTDCVVAIADAQSAVAKTLSDDLAKRLERRIYFASREILAQDKLNDYGWLLTTDRDTLDSDDQKIYDRKKLLLTVGLKISPAYYKARNLTPDDLGVAALCVYYMAFEKMSLADAHTAALAEPSEG